MKPSDLLILGVALGGAYWLVKKFNVADVYGTKPLSDQTRMLQQQDSGFGTMAWSPDSPSVVNGGVWV